MAKKERHRKMSKTVKAAIAIGSLALLGALIYGATKAGTAAGMATVSTTCSGGGYVDPSVSVPYGDTVTLTASANTGYYLSALTVDGVQLTNGSQVINGDTITFSGTMQLASVVLENIKTNHTVVVTFQLTSLTLEYTYNAGGTVTEVTS